ncbi:histidine phosphatase family protein [Nocardiopsis sediminis]|uniref:Histidine phosphatase family protein n=1 Tax=Nocardiopsis sediminis TaxID=1778267 RepID=A0ABV8FQV5_9ACTN
MSTTVVLARHGRTPWHADNRYAGSSDVPIDDVGRGQAAVLAQWAAGFAPDALYCSPLLRARQTAAPVAEATGLTARTDDRIREVAFGVAEGRTLDELDPQVVARFRADPVAHAFPDGEDPRAAAARAAAWVQETALAHDGGRVLAIAHNTLLRLLVCHVMGAPLRGYRRVLPKLDSTGLVRLRAGEAGLALEAYNVPPAAAVAAGAAERKTLT